MREVVKPKIIRRLRHHLPFTCVSYSAIISLSFRNFAGDVISIRFQKPKLNGEAVTIFANKINVIVVIRPEKARGPRIDVDKPKQRRTCYCFLLFKLSALWDFSQQCSSVRFFFYIYINVPDHGSKEKNSRLIPMHQKQADCRIQKVCSYCEHS